MIFKPESSQKFAEVDVNTTNEAIMKNMNSSDSTIGKMKGPVSKPRGEFAIPEAAPVVYPTLGRIAFAVLEDG